MIRCLNRRGVDNIYCYLDDYFVIGSSFEECQEKQMQVIGLLIDMEFNKNMGKVLLLAVSASILVTI